MEPACRAGEKGKNQAGKESTPGQLTGGAVLVLYWPSGESCAQGTAHALPGPRDGLGWPGLDTALPHEALAFGTRLDFALPIAAEFLGETRVREHGWPL